MAKEPRGDGCDGIGPDVLQVLTPARVYFPETLRCENMPLGFGSLLVLVAAEGIICAVVSYVLWYHSICTHAMRGLGNE
jgi:hypothetical protein